MPPRRTLPALLLSLSLLPLSACASGAPDTRVGGATLYDQLGGGPGIEILVDEFLDVLSTDLRIVAQFADTDLSRFRGHLIDQICELADGPCTYTGEDMHTVHAGMEITERDFNALVEDLQDAMERLEISRAAQNRLLAKLAVYQRDVVE